MVLAQNMTRYPYLLLGLLLLLPGAATAQNQDWLDISAEERAIKEVPGDPGAPAIQLYYADYRDDDAKSQFIYKRIKILNEAGRKYADVEIPLFPLFHFVDVKARTIHPDGSIVEFTGKPFEKVIVKTRDVKFVAETFAMPEVTIGSIVEYKYRYDWGSYTFDTTWTVQHDLFTVKERFSLKGYSGGLVTKNSRYGEGTRLSYVVYGTNAPTRGRGGAIELELENVPAFKSEEYAPPEGDLKPSVRFFYGGTEVKSPEAFWQDYGHDWFDQSERFIGNRDPIRNAASQAVAGETDPEKKLRKLYALAQKTRNLSFERSRTKQEDKKEELKQNENSSDVLERGYGTHNDITRLFVALVRAAGFDAQIVRAPNREAYFFKMNYLSASQLGSEIAVVKFNGNDVFLDPGTEFCPFGLVRWLHTSDRGLRLEKTGATFVVIPPALADRSQIHRVAKVVLAADGSVKGSIDVDLTGNGALEERLRALDEDDAGRRKGLEDMAKGWLPEGSLVTLDNVTGWEATEEPLHVRYKVEVPAYASLAGKRLLVPAALFSTTRQKLAFQHADRKYPVYFPFAYQEMDNLILQAPEGYSSEAIPSAQDVKLTSTRFATSRTFGNNQFISKRALIVNGIVFPVSRYPELKDFFDKVQTADQEQLVLQSAAATASK
jgi:transglutaminase-like putative cysteine protease